MSDTTSNRDSKLYLPRDPFPVPFKDQGLTATLGSLLKVVREHPAYVEPTHSAFYRLIIRHGQKAERSNALQRLTGKEDIVAYTTLADKFFGVEEAFYEIVTGYGLQAAKGGRTRRKALVITGSPGAGKSDGVNHLQRNIMRSREPIPYLQFSPMWSNPLNALFLARLIAATKANDIFEDTLTELTSIIDGLDLTGTAALNFGNTEVKAIAKKHGFTEGSKLSSADLAKICMESEKDFVSIVCFGLDLPRATVDALVVPDPWAQDVVLGKYFGKFGPDAPSASEFKEGCGKKKDHPTYGQYDPQYAVDLHAFPLSNLFMSKGQGIVDIAEVQPINFDLKVWRGDEKLATMGLYDSADPRCVDPSGHFNRGKFLVLTEGLRNPPEGFRVLLESLEGQRLPLPEPLSAYHPEGVGWEGMIIIHSNDEQWNKFYGNPDHRAHLDRFRWVSFRYPLEPSEATRVTEKLYNASEFGKTVSDGGVHHEPLSFIFGGNFRVATHLDMPSKGNRPLFAILRAYDGKQVRERMMGTDIDVRALRESAPWTEGLTGMSPREMDDIIGQLAAEALAMYEQDKRPSPCFTTQELRDRLKLRIKGNPMLGKKEKEAWTGWLDNEFETFRRQELTKVYKAAFIPGFRDLCTNYFRKYVAYVRALSLGIRPTGTVGGQAVTQRDMEAFLQEVERADEFNVNSAQAPKFRQGVMAAINLYNEEHGTTEPPYEVHEGLKNCIESYVLRTSKDIVGVVGVATLSEEEQKKIDSAKKRLVEEHGYCEYCAGKLLIEVTLTRDFLKA